MKKGLNEIKNNLGNGKYILRIIACLMILGTGAAGMVVLAGMKKPPAESRPEERALRVKVTRIEPEDVRVTIEGYGRVRPYKRVMISAEVSGIVSKIHPGLDAGRIVRAHELLFAIDSRDYRAALVEAKSSVSRLRSVIARLEKESRMNGARLETLSKSYELAKREHERLKKLFEEDRIGTLSGVEKAEQAKNAAKDAMERLRSAVELYPLRIAEARSELDAAAARLKRAGLLVEKTEIFAPFTGRIVSSSVEKGQFITPGRPVITLADDSLLEIQVPVDADEVANWLLFEDEVKREGFAWFPAAKRVFCKIKAAGGGGDNEWRGILDRIVAYDSKTRTVTLSILIDAASAAPPGQVPLLDGMFCSVSIPGKNLKNVVVLPRHAVSFEGTVYKVVNNRLKIQKVEAVRTEKDKIFITKGLMPKDIVIVTRLVNPFENSRVEIVEN